MVKVESGSETRVRIIKSDGQAFTPLGEVIGITLYQGDNVIGISPNDWQELKKLVDGE